ncbi:CRP-like cAMP-binding protein [Winogradskyella epiphytica]|uniref:CRP-like cAMP-binding protein n=1 Tax=Winogradskyella epiphytica TaxID=262005 RepID=A0A2V4XXL3_9FLAO|nr:Crp/Fnr family transcriptional regulator [Winogradskyella epiphytica]PYE80418.1 CRP-like cAMP-binding protein [Winogradskyella epiphytica]GGW69601.1 cyclic nucleotide-binding protein [Winogradskyella epiphytica]
MTLPNFKRHLIDKHGLSEEQFDQITPFIRTRTISKNKFLLKEGEIGTAAFFVEKGLLRLYNVNSEGKENHLQFAVENWIITDRCSVYFQEPSTSNIDALEDTLTVLLDDELVSEITKVNSTFREQNEILLQNHIRHLYRRISSLIGSSAKVRYIEFAETYPELMQRVPQWMIASYLGITPESLSRVRKTLMDESYK